MRRVITESCPRCGARTARYAPEYLAHVRARAGLSLAAVAKAAGVSISYVHDIEHGRRRCPEAVAKALGLKDRP